MDELFSRGKIFLKFNNPCSEECTTLNTSFFLVIIGNQTMIADFEAHEHKEIQKWNVKTYILKYLPWRRSKTKITDCFLSMNKKKSLFCFEM